jgi:hypothetical protein
MMEKQPNSDPLHHIYPALDDWLKDGCSMHDLQGAAIAGKYVAEMFPEDRDARNLSAATNNRLSIAQLPDDYEKLTELYKDENAVKRFVFHAVSKTGIRALKKQNDPYGALGLLSLARLKYRYDFNQRVPIYHSNEQRLQFQLASALHGVSGFQHYVTKESHIRREYLATLSQKHPPAKELKRAVIELDIYKEVTWSPFNQVMSFIDGIMLQRKLKRSTISNEWNE